MPFFTLAQVDFAKFYIGSSGCSIVAPGYMITDSTYSEDSSLIYSGEIALDSFHFFIILVDIKNPIPDSGLARETVLVNYLDHLKSSFSITESVGYGRGHTLPGYDQALGVLDYWKDEFGDSWSVKGWTDGDTGCFRYLRAGSLSKPFNRKRLPERVSLSRNVADYPSGL